MQQKNELLQIYLHIWKKNSNFALKFITCVKMAFFGLFNREKKETLDKGLEKSKESVLSKISHAIVGKSTVDDDVLDRLEEALVTSDVGVETTLRIIERIQERVKRDKYVGTGELNAILTDEIASLLQENNVEDVLDFSAPLPAKPYVIMVVGVNGVGKTTTIGKLAYQYKGLSRCCRHLQGSRSGATLYMGRTRRRAGHQAATGV